MDWIAIFKSTSIKKKIVTFRGLWGINSLIKKVILKGKNQALLHEKCNQMEFKRKHLQGKKFS